MKRMYVKNGEIRLGSGFSCGIYIKGIDLYLIVRVQDSKKMIEEPIKVAEFIKDPSDIINTMIDTQLETIVTYKFVGFSKEEVNLKIQNLKDKIDAVCKLLKEEMKIF